MGAGSVAGAAFIVPWLRARFSLESITLSANLLIVLAYVFMALARQTEAVFVAAGLAGVGWTLSASELWVAAQRTLPNWVRRRLNPTLIMMISQGGMAVGGVIWGSAATTGGASYTLIGAAVLFLTSLLLTGRLCTLDNLTSRDTRQTLQPQRKYKEFRSKCSTFRLLARADLWRKQLNDPLCGKSAII
jgi:hypothetical protein